MRFEDVEPFALGRHAATGAVHQRDHAIDIWVVTQQAGALDLLRHIARGSGGAVHRCQHADIVAGADLAASAAEALESGLLIERQHGLRLGILGKMVIAGEVLHGDIMFVHPFAGLDRLGGESDDLTELPDWLAFRDGFGGELVLLGNPVDDGNTLNDAANRKNINGNNNIVCCVQAQEARRYVSCGVIYMYVHGTALEKPFNCQLTC